MTEKMYDSQIAPPSLANARIGPRAIAFCLIAAVVFYCVPQSMADPDIWWHLRDAQLQLATHSFITRDLFSFTAAGAPWMNHEWLAELPFYAGFHLLGINGIYVASLLAIEIIFSGILYLAYLGSGSWIAASLATIAGIFLSTISFGPRTLLFGWILLVIELLIFTRSRQQERIVWTLPILFLVWVNTHGSWLIGITIFLLFILSSGITLQIGCIENRAASRQQLGRLAMSWALSAAALFLNPYGWRLVFYPFNLAFHQKLNVANVEEWQSLDFHSPRGRILLFSLVLLFLLQLLRARKWSLFELALACVGIYSALNYSRFLFLAAILVMPLLAASLAPFTLALRLRLTPLLRAALAILILGCILGPIRTHKANATLSDPRFPQKALPFLSTFHPQGRVFNEQLWGGYLIWNKRDIPVFGDSRIDIFEYNGSFKDYLDIIRLTNPLALLDKYQIRYVLFESKSPLTYLLKVTGKWKVDYEDDTTVLLERASPASK